MTYPRLTCVINVRNGERFIQETLETAFAQSEPVAILVVDNQSTDATRAIVEKYPEIRYVKTPRAMELGSARSYSLNFVETEWVAWLDADDLWDSQFCAMSLRAFAENPRVVLSGCGCILVDQHGKDLQQWRQSKKVKGQPAKLFVPGDSLESLSRSMQAKSCWSGYVFKTAVVKALGGFSPQYRHAVDFDLILRALTKGDSCYINRNLLRIRIHPQQATRTFKPEELYSESYRILMDNNKNIGFLSAKSVKRVELINNFRIRAGCFFAKHSFYDGVQVVKYLCRPTVMTWVLRYIWARVPV